MPYKDRTRQIESVRNTQRRSRHVRQQLVAVYKTIQGCMNCTERDPIALDLHHPNKDKEDKVSNLVNRKVKWSKIEAEMNKCIVLCANCHRKEHKSHATVAQLVEQLTCNQ